MFLKSLFTSLKEDAEKFKLSVDTLIDGYNKEISQFSIFNPEVKKARTEEAQQELERIAAHQAAHFTSVCNGKIARARAYILNAVMTPNVERLASFRALTEAAGGLISNDEMSLLLTSSSGDYWSLKYLSGLENKLTDTTTAAGILSLSIPSPDLAKYLDVLETAKQGQSGFFANYRGSNAVGGSAEQIREILFLNGLPHQHWGDTFNAICPYFVDDKRCMLGTFDASDRAMIEKILGNSGAYKCRDTVKTKIADSIKDDPHLEGVFWRSEYADVLEEIKTEAEIRAQKKLLDDTLANNIKAAGEQAIEILATEDN